MLWQRDGVLTNRCYKGPMNDPCDFTFVCLADNQVATFVDVRTLAPEGVRRHAIGLLREHASASTVEIWCGEAVCETVDRDGARTIVESPGRDQAAALRP
jgi:hypothetical protein